jgi:hypothetical protein
MTIQWAADYAIRLSKSMGYGLAVHKASYETGASKKEIQAELNKRRRSKK